VNGAGKTTTFKMLCGEVPPSSGQVYIAGFDLYQNLDQIRENIGYCPQFDALLDNLTSRDHLELFAALKGIPSSNAKKLIDKKLNEMNLRPFEHVCAGTYSGGNKRKLSVALAMLGNPPIVFLDEPSTGMDPEARRFMWNVISRISSERKRSSIILTTHSMEEAEALSNRIAIMVNGSFQCLGTVQHIKNKFGKGYELDVKLNIPRRSDYDELLRICGKNKEARIFQTDIERIFSMMGKGFLVKEIRDGGFGAHIHHDIDNPNGIAIEILLEFVITETEGGVILV
jgi:ATP-binding cassette subfamily A (ABC1) protein 3